MKKIQEINGIIFRTIKFRNFMSFGNCFTEVNLDSQGTTLLIGENLDNGGSSGAGKSTLINAISYCLYDKIPSGVSKDKLINRTNEKKNTLMEVYLVFTKGEDEYTVKRWRGSSTGVQLLLNGTDITPSSVNRGEDSFNAKIEDIVGFSYNLFAQIILFNGNSQPFLDMSVGAQRALIEELFKITILSRKAVALKKIISETDKEITVQKLLIQHQEKQNDSHRKHVLEAQERVNKWDSSRIVELEDVQLKLEKLSKIDFDLEESIHSEIIELKAEIAKLQSSARELATKKVSKEKERSPKQAQLTINQNDLKKQQLELSKIEKELIHLRDAKCPYCLQSFEDAQSKILEIETKSKALKVDITTMSEMIKQLELEIAEFNSQNLVEIESIAVLHTQALTDQKTLQSQLDEILVSLHFKDLASLVKSKSELVVLQERLEKMITEINPHIEAHVALIAEGEIKVDTKVLDELMTIQDHQQFLLKLLTDKNSFIRKNIISKTIPFLNKRIAFYTEKLNLPHIVVFQSDMTCQITQIGRELDHGNLSNGEKKKLNLSLCLAFRDVLTYLHAKVNVLFTDEVDSGTISGVDLNSLITLLNNKAIDDEISIIIVSHRSEFEDQCNNYIVISKENGFSSISKNY
jgi:DNA repair exonuclease SbcCD ATPase subunit